MRILLTGSSGSVGSAVLLHLLENEHSVTSLDIHPLPARITSLITSAQQNSLTHHLVDLLYCDELDEIFTTHGPFDGAIHLSALPSPVGHDPRDVHNINVVTAYNLLKTAADHGVKRIVQASSVNAPGLSFTPEGRQMFDELPLREDAPMRSMDPYALSKHINEIQAENLVRIDPALRIASLRFHMVVSTYEEAVPRSRWTELFSWVSHRACAKACLLGLISEGWEGAEAFNIVAPEICWEAGVSEAIPGHEELRGKVGAVELVKKAWAGRVRVIHEEYWSGNPRRGFWDTEKATKLLDWRHE